MRYRSFLLSVLAIGLSFVVFCSKAMAESKSILTYDQIHGTGLAANCPEVDNSARGKIEISSTTPLKLTDVCFQPVRMDVEEEKRNGDKEFIETKSILLYGATLGPIKAEVKSLGAENALELDVTDGMMAQPTTVQLPRRERLALLFTVRDLKAVAKGSSSSIDPSTDFEGKFKVPGYHMSTFLDPKGRGSGTGYESAVGLQASQEKFQPNVKQDEIAEGELSLRIARVNPKTGEIAGSFVSYQPSSTEQGSMEAKLVRIQGLFYGRVDS